MIWITMIGTMSLFVFFADRIKPSDSRYNCQPLMAGPAEVQAAELILRQGEIGDIVRTDAGSLWPPVGYRRIWWCPIPLVNRNESWQST